MRESAIIGRMGKNIWIRAFGAVMTVSMLTLSGYGAYALATAPQKAQAAAEAIEEMLRKNQEEAERMKEEQQRKIDDMMEARTNNELLFRNAREMRIVGIGDSVMLAALPQLYETFPNGYFDAVFGRTIYEGMRALNQLEAEDKLGEVLLFSLGTNCYIHDEDVEELIRHSGGRPTFWLSTYGVANDSNEVTKRVIANYDNAFYIDWETLALANRSRYISSDALHPNEEGSYAYANLIADTITKDIRRYELSKTKHPKPPKPEEETGQDTGA